jgi:hypothetical protein
VERERGARTRRGLSSSGNDTLPAVVPRRKEYPPRSARTSARPHVSRRESAAQKGDSLYARNALGCNSAAPRHRVERDSLSKQEASSGASNSRDFYFGSVLGRSDGVAFLQVPLDAVSHPSQEWLELGPSPGSNKEKKGDGRAAELGKDLVDKGNAGQNTLHPRRQSQHREGLATRPRERARRTSLLPHKVASSCPSPTTNPP